MTPIEYVEEVVRQPKEAKELKDAVVGLLKAIRKATADGFQGQDVITIVSGEFNSLVTGVSGVEKLPEQVKEDLASHLECTGLMAGQIAKVFTTPQVVVQAEAAAEKQEAPSA